MEGPKKEEKLNTPKTETSKGSAGTGDTAAKPEAPKRKKNIIRVYHAQNASDGGRSHKKAAGERRRTETGAAGAVKRPAAAGERTAGTQQAARPQTAAPASAARGSVRQPADKISAAAAPGAGAAASRPAPTPSKENTQPAAVARPAGSSAEINAAGPAASESARTTDRASGAASSPVRPQTAAAASPEAKSAPALHKEASVPKPTGTEGTRKEEKGSICVPAEETKTGQSSDSAKSAPSQGQETGPAGREPKAAPAKEPAEAKKTAQARPEDTKKTGSVSRERTAAVQGSAPDRSAGSAPASVGRAGLRTADQGTRPAARQTAEGGAGMRSGDRRMTDRPGQSPRQGQGSGQGRPAARGTDGQTGRFSRPADGSRTGGMRSGAPGQGGGRFGQGSRGAGQAPGRSDGRGGPGPRGGGQRPGQGGRGQAAFAPDLGKSGGKDSRRERDKNHKKDFDRTNQPGGGRRPVQGQTRPGGKNKGAAARPVPAPKPEVKEIIIPETLTIRELADAMKMQPSVIVKKLFLQGEMVTVNSEIDFEKAQEIALEYDIIAEKEEQVDIIEELLKEDDEKEEDLKPRPPVVCVMGHVDHGKTSLLDYIRNTHVTRGEAGGITQHIGAYVVDIHGQKITFLDTPGHEAFTAMRMRGADATDIAVLVVAADDGVMPQTVEAISHAKAAGVEIIVAINKIDKPAANIDKVKQELTEYQLVAEDWGGTTPMVPVSAQTGEGIDELLEMILLTAEVSELKANPNRAARGLVIEAKLDKGKGPVATILIQKGTLHQGDFIAAGSCSGKVRAMMDDQGGRLKEAGPSMPVEILGLNDVPGAGEVLMSFPNDKEAKSFAETFVAENKKHLLEETKGKLSLDNLFDQIQASDLKELPIIVKADVQGSVEAVRSSLLKLSNEEVVVKVIHGGVGAINESDVTLAATSNAIIIGFNVRPDNLAKQLAEQEGVDMRLYKVIYQAIEDVEAAMKGMLDPVFEEKVIGHAQVRQLFKASGVGTIAGSYVLDGIFQRNCRVRITRDSEQIYEGELASLKRFKDDVKEVRAGYEFGLVFQDFNDVKEEDLIEAYIMVEVPR